MGTGKGKNRPAAADLRRRAEERLRAESAELHQPRPDVETPRLVHELQVHQIELEMQNAELRQARDEVEKALESYTDLYDFAPVGYFTLDRNGVIGAVNLSGASLVGIERAKFHGRAFGQFLSDEARPLFLEFLGRVLASQGKECCEVALLKKGTHTLYAHIEAVAAASGQECRVAMIDISVRRQLEKKLGIVHADLAARSAALECANIELEAFNYSVSHDLRNPLTAISGYSQVLQTLCGDTLDEESRRYVREIYKATMRMSRLIDTLLDFSRVAHVEMHRETVDLSAIAKAVAAELELAEPERRVTFRVAERIMVVGDAGLWRIVMDNLIGNAWRYTAGQEARIIEFGVKDSDEISTFFVRDNGPGFDMAHAEKLFIPFQRIPGIDVEGHGIGLSTVQRIVTRHGGRVWAESEPGKGATFYFTLKS